jgi:hypothetical protein
MATHRTSLLLVAPSASKASSTDLVSAAVILASFFFYSMSLFILKDCQCCRSPVGLYPSPLSVHLPPVSPCSPLAEHRKPAYLRWNWARTNQPQLK